jgi:ABC-type phosphate/phosphonate transport system substrate-binding protein
MSGGFVANARMYAVGPQAETAWRVLLARICDAAEVPLHYIAYPAPQPLEALWSRRDLGAVLMCGFPIASKLADVRPIAAPVPSVPWAHGRAVYRTDLIVRADAPLASLPDTFGGRLGWTVRHSHSGFNAPRHHLLRFRSPERPALYRTVVGDLVTARRVLDAVVAGEIDVGPLDAYWHHLLRRYRPDLTVPIRILESTDTAPMPAFVASAALPAQSVERLKQSFAAARAAAWFAPLAEALSIEGFVPVGYADYAPTLAWEADALAAGYPEPA